MTLIVGNRLLRSYLFKMKSCDTLIMKTNKERCFTMIKRVRRKST